MSTVVACPETGNAHARPQQDPQVAVARSGARPLTRAERLFDIVGVLIALPFVIVVGSLIALAVFIDSPGPVLYRCRRIGYGGRPFEMLKFRKMTRSAKGGFLTMADDERFTPIGRFLAVTKLDEMPQLWNVLKGEMRLVGPRPEVEWFVSRYADAYREILTAVPGITGPAAIEFASEGRMFAGRDDVTAFYCSELLPRKIDLDIEYVRTRTVWSDAALLLRTSVTPLGRVVSSLFSGARGVSANRLGHATMYGMGTILLLVFGVSAGPV